MKHDRFRITHAPTWGWPCFGAGECAGRFRAGIEQTDASQFPAANLTGVRAQKANHSQPGHGFPAESPNAMTGGSVWGVALLMVQSLLHASAMGAAPMDDATGKLLRSGLWHTPKRGYGPDGGST